MFTQHFIKLISVLILVALSSTTVHASLPGDFFGSHYTFGYDIYGLNYLERSLEEVAAGGSAVYAKQFNIPNDLPSDIQYNLLVQQLQALKTAKKVSINNDENRYLVGLITWGGIAYAGVRATYVVASKVFNMGVLQKNPVTKIILSILTISGGYITTEYIARKSTEFMILTEDELQLMITDVETRITQLKK